MTKTNTSTGVQHAALVVLRILIGWHFLYEGISKLLSPDWSSSFFLRESQWILSGFAEWILSNESILKVVDFLNIWGLIFIGAGLVLGMFTRIASISGIVLLLLYYFNNAPIIGIEYTIPSEGSNLWVNKTLIEAAALFVISVFQTGEIFGLDFYLTRARNKK